MQNLRFQLLTIADISLTLALTFCAIFERLYFSTSLALISAVAKLIKGSADFGTSYRYDRYRTVTLVVMIARLKETKKVNEGIHRSMFVFGQRQNSAVSLFIFFSFFLRGKYRVHLWTWNSLLKIFNTCVLKFVFFTQMTLTGIFNTAITCDVMWCNKEALLKIPPKKVQLEEINTRILWDPFSVAVMASKSEFMQRRKWSEGFFLLGHGNPASAKNCEDWH
jgi:hypothetical protein